MSEKLKPPPTIQTCRVLEYSKPDADITATQRCFSGDKEVGPIVWLAICQNMKTAEIVLFFVIATGLPLAPKHSNPFCKLSHLLRALTPAYPPLGLSPRSTNRKR